MSARYVLLLSFGLVLAACVAPPDPEPRRAPVVSTSPTPPRANLEDAPVPNRRAHGPIDRSIRVQQ